MKAWFESSLVCLKFINYSDNTVCSVLTWKSRSGILKGKGEILLASRAGWRKQD